jgi:hypothetical protein
LLRRRFRKEEIDEAIRVTLIVVEQNIIGYHGRGNARAVESKDAPLRVGWRRRTRAVTRQITGAFPLRGCC